MRNTYKGAYVIFTTDGLTRDQTRDPLVFKLNFLIVIFRRGSDKLLLFGKNILDDGKHFFVPLRMLPDLPLILMDKIADISSLNYVKMN